MLLSPNDDRNLRKDIIAFIVKITNVFSNRATSEHWSTLLKFIYIGWATPKRFFHTKVSPGQGLKAKGRPQGERETTKI